MVLNSGMEQVEAFVQRAKPSVRLRLTDSSERRSLAAKGGRHYAANLTRRSSALQGRTISIHC